MPGQSRRKVGEIDFTVQIARILAAMIVAATAMDLENNEEIRRMRLLM